MMEKKSPYVIENDSITAVNMPPSKGLMNSIANKITNAMLAANKET